MLNSLSNNPGDGNQYGLNAGAQPEPIIQEVYEDEPNDYNYEPQIREVDEVELKNLSAIREEDNVDRRVYLVCGIFLIAALIGAAVGYLMANNSAGKAEVQRKSSIAQMLKKTFEQKQEGFKQYKKDFEKIAKAPTFDETAFDNKVMGYNRAGFILDMASEVTSEAVLLIDGSADNPLKGLRQYSADTMLLTQLLSTHINETHADAESIVALQEQDEGEITYAMQYLPEAVNFLGTTAPRYQYANMIVDIYTLKGFIEDDQKASETYSKIKIDQKWSEEQRFRRDYHPEGKKGANAEALDLPNHLIYEVLDRKGKESQLFADEVVTVNRSLLFGKSANALERYKARNQQILELLDDAEKASATVVSALDKFIVDGN